MSSITTETRKGPRSYQEDRHYESFLAECDLEILAVMDGHNGYEVAEFCCENIFRMMSVQRQDPKEKIGELVANLNSATRNYASGSTLSVALISEEFNTATVGILGDSPVVIFDSRGQVHFSPEHNVRTNIKEREAAIQRGGYYDSTGYICIGNNGLQLSRALGDSPLSSILSRKPQIYTISEPVWILIASDGIFDPSHKNMEGLKMEIEILARSRITAKQIMDWAMRRGLEDNATAVVWQK